MEGLGTPDLRLLAKEARELWRNKFELVTSALPPELPPPAPPMPAVSDEEFKKLVGEDRAAVFLPGMKTTCRKP